MQLYNFDLSPFAARCRLAVYRKGLPVEIVAPPEGGPRSEAYRRLNPLGKIPALALDDGTVIPESEVIVEYLEDRFPSPSLRPESPEARARMRVLSRIGDVYLMPPMGRLFGQISGSRDQAVIDAALADVDKALGALEHFLAGDGWAMGEAFTLADCSLLPQLFFLPKVLPAFGRPEPLAATPRLAAYWERSQSDAIIAKVLAEMEAGLQRMMAQRQGA